MVIEVLDSQIPSTAGPVAVAGDDNTSGLVLVKKARDLLVLFRKQQAGAARAANQGYNRLPEGMRPGLGAEDLAGTANQDAGSASPQDFEGRTALVDDPDAAGAAAKAAEGHQALVQMVIEML
ncbi:unnamed protein product, partial [Pylaiella littoralis]